MRFVSTSFQQSSSFYARTSGSESGSLISSSFYIATTTDLGGFDANFGTKKVIYTIPSASAGGTSDVKALSISASGVNPRVGIGVESPRRAFDFKEVRDDNRGGEMLIRGSRTTKGAEINDEVGRVNFVIDSSSYQDIELSGSAAEIVALVDDVDSSGIVGSLSLKVATSKTTEPTQRLRLLGYPIGGYPVQFTGSADFDTNVNIGNNLTIDGQINSFITASSGISASGDIETSGDMIASNFFLPAGGGNFQTIGNAAVISIDGDNIDLGFGGSPNWQLELRQNEGIVLYDFAHLGPTAYRDFRIEGNSDTHLFFVTGGDARVGIGTDTPTEKLTVEGNISASGLSVTGNVTASSNVDIQGTLSLPGFNDVSASLAAAVAGGDNLGNHIATQDLNMGGNNITSVGNVDGVDVSTLKSDFDTLEGKTLVSGSSQISLGSATGTVDISSQTNLVGGTNLTLSGDTMNLDANISLTSITASGAISASGILTSDDYRMGDRKFATSNPDDSKGILLGNNGDGNLTLTNITASGIISASDNIFGGNNLYLNGYSVLTQVSTLLDVGADASLTTIRYGKNGAPLHNFQGKITTTGDITGSATNILLTQPNVGGGGFNYLRTSGDIAGGTFTFEVGDVDTQYNGTKIDIDDGNESVSITGNLDASGVIKLAAGSNSAPSLTFSSDTNTGIYAIAPDTLGITSGGSLKLNVGSTSVGVNVPFSVTDNTDNTNTTLVNINNTNTGAPISTNQYSLKVVGGAAWGAPGAQHKSYGGYFTAGDTNTANPDSVALYAQGHEDGAPNSYAALFSGSAGGVVGINTLEPTVELEVDGDGKFSGTLEIGGISDVSASIAAAGGGGGSDNLGDHTATQDLDLNSNSIKGITHITASGNISASGIIVPQYESKVHAHFTTDATGDLIPMGGTLNETTTPQYYLTYMAPYGGQLIRAYVMTTSSSTGDFTLSLRKYTNFSTFTTIATATGTISTSYTPTLVTFSAHTFDQGDWLAIFFAPTGTPSGVNVTSLWRMDSI